MHVAGLLIAQGVGVAFVMTPIITVGMNAAGRQDIGSASWILNVCHRGGGAFSITILGALLEREHVILDHYMGTAPMLGAPGTDALQGVAQGMGFPHASAGEVAMAQALHSVSTAAITVAFEHMFLIAALTSVSLVLPALLLGGRRRREMLER